MHNPTEHVQEHVTHEVAHGGHDEHGHGGHSHASWWITAAALTAAILAAFAAVSGNLATTHLTQSTHKRIDSNDKWSYYQSKSLKNYLLQAQDSIIEASVPAANLTAKTKSEMAANIKKIAENEEIKTQTAKEAAALEHLSAEHLESHEHYELSATMFHISIAIVAIAVVAKRKEFWYISMISGVIGLYFFGSAMIHSPAIEASAEGAESGAPAAQHAPAGEHSPAAGEHAPAAHAGSATHAAAENGSAPAPDADHNAEH
jgi:hypothetical protein